MRCGHVGVPGDGERDVGERSDGDDPRVPVACLEQEVHRVPVRHRLVVCRQRDAAKPRFPVDDPGISRHPKQGGIGPGIHRRVHPKHGGDRERIRGCGIKRRIASHGRDPNHLRMAMRQDQRDSIVMTRITVNNHPLHGSLLCAALASEPSRRRSTLVSP